MTTERRNTDQEILAKLDELKDEFKEHKKEVKETIDSKLDIQNKFYFNGYQPHEHIEDHHYIKTLDKKKHDADHRVVDGIVEEMQDDKRSTKKLVRTWLDRGFWAAASLIATLTWTGIQDKFSELPSKPKTEQAQNANTPRHP